MQTKKLQANISTIASLMQMHESEVREFPYKKEIFDAINDYNLKVLSKKQLFDKLYVVSEKCAKEKIYHYSTGIDNLISTIRYAY